MRKALVLLLLASVAAPAFASTEDNDRQGRRGERAERAERAEKSEEGERVERAARPERPERPERPAPRAERSGDERPESVRHQLRERRIDRVDDGDAAPAIVRRSNAPDNVRDRRARERFRENGPTVIQERNRNGAEVIRDRLAGRDSRPVSRIPRQGTQPPISAAARRLVNHHWRGDWRNDRRYDWRRHRSRYSSLFNFGFYRDPFGWGYQPFSIGWRMWPSYYSRSYWLSDPWQYRLPYAPPGYRWIRYYDDAILVDTWDGQVVDVIRNFFW